MRVARPAPRQSRHRGSIAVAGVAAVVALAGCFPLPPTDIREIPGVVEPGSFTGSATPPADTSLYVQPDYPASDVDLTLQTVGLPYGGATPIAASGYSADAGIDVVFAPSRGVPVPQAAAVWGDSLEALPYLEDVVATPTGDLVQSTVGQLVMTDTAGAQSSCTGTVINTLTDNIVLTAAHCLQQSSTLQDFVSIEFVPGYDRGERPFGTWSAEAWWYPEQYRQSMAAFASNPMEIGWMAYDVGFIRLAPNAQGANVEQVTGGQGIAFTAETNGYSVVGYPVDDELDGEIQRWCSATTPAFGVDNAPAYSINCAMSGGTAGAGLLTNLDSATGAATITGVWSISNSTTNFASALGGTAYNGLLSLQRPAPLTQVPSDHVQPLVPASSTDLTFNNTGPLYAGVDPVTASGWSSDGAIDVVIQPTTGQPNASETTPYGDDNSGGLFQPSTSGQVGGNLVQSTVGRIIGFMPNGSSYSCSATVVNSATRNIAITAAHCLLNPDNGIEAVAIEFVPAYDSGDEPFGLWHAEDWWLPEQYAASDAIFRTDESEYGWMAYDVGFIVLEPNDQGQEIQDVVGGQGLAFTGEAWGATAVGYPAEPEPMDGEHQRMCGEPQLRYGERDFPSWALDCRMGGGASGSGLITSLDGSTGAGLIVGIYSYGNGRVEHGPVLGATAYSGYLEVQANS